RKRSPKIVTSSRRCWSIGGLPPTSPASNHIQIAADFAKGTIALFAGAQVPSYPDEETTLAELKARIAKTVKFVEGFKPKDIDGSETRDITLTVGGQESVSKVSLISCTLRCRTSIST